MIGQLHSVVIDAPDAHALAGFYADLLGMEISKGGPGDDWVVVSGAGYRLSFQQAPDLVPPDWPDPGRPQQFHLNCDTGSADLRRSDEAQSDQRKHFPTPSIVGDGLPSSCAIDVPSATARPLNYGALSLTARETIRQIPGARIAGYVRHYFPDGQWHGDRCGCPDDRCAGYHHDAGEACGCLPVVLGEYAQARCLGSGWAPATGEGATDAR